MARSASVKIKYIGSTAASSASASTSSSGTGTSSTQTVQGGTYTVKKGDCLWNIAKKYYGNGVKYTIIYEANKSLIEEVAKKHGKASSDNGHWIWEGTVLTIPDIAGQTSTTSNDVIVGSPGNKSTDIGENISSLVESFSYTDESTGKSDSISVSIMNIDKEWLADKMPERGATLKATIKTTDWGQGNPSFDCGTFILDDLSFSGRPLSCSIGAISAPANVDFKAKTKTVTWQKTTLKGIAEKIASAAGVKLYYSGGSVDIAENEQNNKTDSAYLYEMCEKYGFSMKVYNKKIVIFDTAEAEAKDAVLDLSEPDLESWSYNTTLDGTYTGIEFTYTNPDTKDKNNRKIKVTVGKAGRMYYANAQATSKYDAEMQAKALLAKANRSIETMDITIRANNSVVAGQCINIRGLGKANGKYYVSQIKHSISSGYKMKLSLYKVASLKKKNTNGNGGTDSSSGNASGGEDYVVKKGDCLWNIAKKYYGNGIKYTIIYEANKSLIEEVAKKHGKASSDNGHWIWAGTVLKIPKLEG